MSGHSGGVALECGARDHGFEGASLGFLIGVGSTVATADEVIILGAPVSLTGKHSQNGANTRNGYDLAIRKINEKGGISIGGKSYYACHSLLRRRVDAGTRHRARRAPDQARRRQVHARAAQLGPRQSDPAYRPFLAVN
jgi:hypothetical protein